MTLIKVSRHSSHDVTTCLASQAFDASSIVGLGKFPNVFLAGLLLLHPVPRDLALSNEKVSPNSRWSSHYFKVCTFSVALSLERF